MLPILLLVMSEQCFSKARGILQAILLLVMSEQCFWPMSEAYYLLCLSETQLLVIFEAYFVHTRISKLCFLTYTCTTYNGEMFLAFFKG